jgi:hypothetical protein
MFAFVLAISVPAWALDLRDLGFDTSISELLLFERLNYSVRYDATEKIKADWSGSYDRINTVEIESVENRYALFENDALRRADVAIRGTVNIRNAVLDLELLKAWSPNLGIYLHSGFEKVAMAVYADLRPRLREGYTIRLTGHSLGAAEAIILGMLFVRDGYVVEKIVATAPPKVTDADGWSVFDTLPVIRLAEAYDPVPFFPSENLVYKQNPFIQGGKALLLLDGLSLTVVDGSFYDDLPEEKKAVYADGQEFDVADHFLSEYIRRLLSKINGFEYVDPAEWDHHAVPAKR